MTQAYEANRTRPDGRLHPASYLRGCRWEDELQWQEPAGVDEAGRMVMVTKSWSPDDLLGEAPADA